MSALPAPAGATSPAQKPSRLPESAIAAYVAAQAEEKGMDGATDCARHWRQNLRRRIRRGLSPEGTAGVRAALAAPIPAQDALPAPAQPVAAHTPGPWFIRGVDVDRPSQGYQVEHVSATGRSIVADCRDYAVCEEHGTAEANAALIASAPALLAERDALRALIAGFCAEFAGGIIGTQLDAHYRAMIAALAGKGAL